MDSKPTAVKSIVCATQDIGVETQSIMDVIGLLVLPNVVHVANLTKLSPICST